LHTMNENRRFIANMILKEGEVTVALRRNWYRGL